MTKIQKIETTNPNPFFIDAIDSATRAFSQEFLLLLFISLFVIIKKKIEIIYHDKKLYQQYFKSKSNSFQIKQILIEIMYLVDADRVVLLLFHNNEKYLGQFNQLKVSLFDQVSQPSITNVDKIINLPINLLYREIDEVLDIAAIVWQNKKECFDKCRDYLSSIGVEMQGLKMLRNHHRSPIGLLGIQYCSNDYIYVILNEDKMKELNILIDKIENLLN